MNEPFVQIPLDQYEEMKKEVTDLKQQLIDQKDPELKEIEKWGNYAKVVIIILLIICLGVVTVKAQIFQRDSFWRVKTEDTTYFRIGNAPGYGKTDTLPARLHVVAGPHWDKRKVAGFVILKETPKGCRRIGFLTIYKKRFPRRFELLNYELIN